MWQDISTAPRDGSNILVFDGIQVYVAHFFEPSKVIPGWFSLSFSGATEYDDDVAQPTHWMPLPEAPK